MEPYIKDFLKRYHDPKQPVLLALSGGPDSLALYQMLVEHQKKHPFSFAVAHVDHGWREESGKEARILEARAENDEVPFHLKKLNPAALKGNLEAECREERRAFFRELCGLYGYQAVLLAHHADDQAETVLKRFFEGSSLINARGLREVSAEPGLILWRPLLKYSKKEIVEWLDKKGLKGFEDATNLDPRFLRGRLRSNVIPALSQMFGKNISTSLLNAGREAGELRGYLETKLAPIMEKIQSGMGGLFLDLNGDLPLHPFELKYLLREFCARGNMKLSRSCLEVAAALLNARAGDKVVQTGSRNLYVDRGRAFLPKGFSKYRGSFIPLTAGTQGFCGWVVRVTESDRKPESKATDWKGVWQGRCSVVLPAGDYFLGPALAAAVYPRESPLSTWWTKAKVPAFLRDAVPVVWEGKDIIHEFLTGKITAILRERTGWIEILMERQLKGNEDCDRMEIN